MAEGRATYKIDVDARGAQASLDGVVKGALPKFEKLSGSINAAASSFGGLGGQAGKTFGLVKQLGESFLQTGVFGLGIAAGVLAISHVVKKMDEAKERSEALAKSLTDAQARALGIVTQSYKDMGAELAALSGRSAEYRVEQAALAAQTAKIAADEAERRERAAGSAARRAEDGGPINRIFGIQTDEQIKAQEEWTKASGEAAIARAQLTDATNDLRAAEASLFVSREKGTAPGKGGGKSAAEREREITRGSFQSQGPGVAENLRLERELQGKEEVSAAEFEARIAEQRETSRAETMQRIRMQAEEDVAARRIDVEQQTADEIGRIQQGIFAQYVDMAQGAVMSVSGMFFDSLEALAAGQKVSFEEMAAGFIRNIGEQLVAIGVRNVFEGAGMIAAGIGSSNPQLISGGSMMVANGLAAGAAGAAMAASGAVAQGALSARSGGGGGGGSGSSTMRPSRREGMGGGDDGGRSVTIVYNGGTFLGDSRQHERDRRRHMSNVFVPGVA
jgi:hypothetical protein